MVTQRLLFSFLLPFFLLNAYAIGESAQSRGSSTREAIGKGEVAQALSEMEAQALAAEREKEWGKAANSYTRASNAARISGQLQKAISYGSKAFEMAQNSRDPALQALAALQLAGALRSAGQRAKVREWLEKGISVGKHIQPIVRKQLISARLYRDLGREYAQEGETQKAIENISYSVQVLEERLSSLKSRSRQDTQAIQNGENQLAHRGSARAV